MEIYLKREWYTKVMKKITLIVLLSISIISLTMVAVIVRSQEYDGASYSNHKKDKNDDFVENEVFTFRNEDHQQGLSSELTLTSQIDFHFRNQLRQNRYETKTLDCFRKNETSDMIWCPAIMGQNEFLMGDFVGYVCYPEIGLALISFRYDDARIWDILIDSKTKHFIDVPKSFETKEGERIFMFEFLRNFEPISSQNNEEIEINTKFNCN